MAKSKKFTGLKIFWFIIFVAMTAFLLYGLIDVLSSKGQDGWQVALVAYLTIMVIIIGMIGYGVCILIALFGIVLSLINKGETKSSLISFMVMAVLPIIAEVIFIVIANLLA